MKGEVNAEKNEKRQRFVTIATKHAHRTIYACSEIWDTSF